MDFNSFREAIASPYFTTPYARQLLPELAPAYLAVQLTRWRKAGRLVALRRGLYVFADAVNAPSAPLANLIVQPSYLSGLWALGYHGMIPEAVWELTSACRTTPRRRLYDTPAGRFSYRQVKFFGGYERVEAGGQPFLLATPEKALLDTWYWAGGEWTVPRHVEMRYQHLDGLRPDRLDRDLQRFGSPRLRRARETFREAGKSIRR